MTAGWRWQEGVVDLSKDHIELRYVTKDETSIPIAVLSAAKKRLFTVQFLPTESSPDLDPSVLRSAARKELDYFLIELGEPDPWAYAKYHCRTASNLYSDVCWSFRAGKEDGEGSVSRRLAGPKRPKRSV